MLIANPLPVPLFKYTRREFAESMMRHGHFRIGTLHEFRKEEAHGGEIGDAGEGTKQLVDHLDGDWREVTSRPNLAEQVFKVGPGANIKFSGVTVQMHQEVPDMYVFCVSAVLDKEVMGAFKADTCLAITNPKGFFEALDAAMRAKGLVRAPGVVVGCVYADRERDIRHDGNLNPAQLKPQRYSYQREMRVLWEPATSPIKPEFIDSLVAGKHLRLESM